MTSGKLTVFTVPEAPAIAAEHLVVEVGDRRLVGPLDLEVASGTWTSLVGPNGAGKSTLLRALAGLIPHGGKVRWQGRPRDTLSARARGRHLAWLGHDLPGGEDLLVEDVVMLGRLPHQGLLSGVAASDREAVDRALDAAGATYWRRRALGTLSAGERQRVRLARALAVEAPILFLDEPLANLDPPHQADVLALVRRLVTEGRTVVTVLHELQPALSADRMLILECGGIRHHGACTDSRTHRELEAVFLDRIAIHHLGDVAVPMPRS
ncbi:MAG: ABC transporter ATP-binding protein [Candidatus Sericytochromatia bacterium]|nr:ABC transporter ATP-binding protein [Candidatus Sericytochromatia bacterium]